VKVSRVVEHRHIHACPNFPEGHAWRTARQVVEVVESGPCLSPITLPGPGAVSIACARRLREERRCANCRVVIEVVGISLHVIAREAAE